MFFGNELNKPLADAAKNAVRSTHNFNWTFIALLAFVVYVYASEFKQKNFRGIAAGLALYMVHQQFLKKSSRRDAKPQRTQSPL